MKLIKSLAVAGTLALAPLGAHAAPGPDFGALIADGVSALGPLDLVLQPILSQSGPVAGSFVQGLPPLFTLLGGFASPLNPLTNSIPPAGFTNFVPSGAGGFGGFGELPMLPGL